MKKTASRTSARINRCRSKSKPKAQEQAGLSAQTALTNYQAGVGKAIMRPDGNRAYLPLNLWAAPIWLPDNRAGQRRKFPLKWTDKNGNKYEVNGSEAITANPDMGVLLGLVAIFQDYMIDNDVFCQDIQGISYVTIKVPMSHLYMATGYTWRAKHRLIESIKRLQTLSVDIRFANRNSGAKRIIFANFFNVDYIEPQKGGTGQIVFYVNRLFIPRPVGYLWHPAKLCQALKLETSKLIYWAIATYTHGWSGTAKDLYYIINRHDKDVIAQIESDPVSRKKLQQNYWRWKKDRLQPSLDELQRHGFTVRHKKNAYGENEIGIYWPSAKKSLAIDAEIVDTDVNE